jgi:hypothetical protein
LNVQKLIMYPLIRFHAMVSDKTVQQEPLTETAYEEIPIMFIVNGFAQWRLPNGDLHSPDNDTPAKINAYGAFYYRNGLVHRDNNLPAAVFNDGAREYYVHNRLHNTIGPAVIRANGDCAYFVNGFLHNAIEDTNAAGAFRQLPAVIGVDGTRIYYVRHKVHRGGGLPAVNYANGDTEFREHGILHCLTGPCMTFANGDTEFREHGILHNLNGAARTYANGDAEYWQYGKLHNLDGASKVFADPNVEDHYYLEGARMSRADHAELIRVPWIYFRQ